MTICKRKGLKTTENLIGREVYFKLPKGIKLEDTGIANLTPGKLYTIFALANTLHRLSLIRNDIDFIIPVLLKQEGWNFNTNLLDSLTNWSLKKKGS